MLKVGFDFKDLEFLEIFKRKLAEDNFAADLKNYRYHLGHNKEEIENMKSRLEKELFPILPLKEKNVFKIQDVLEELNRIFKDFE